MDDFGLETHFYTITKSDDHLHNNNDGAEWLIWGVVISHGYTGLAAPWHALYKVVQELCRQLFPLLMRSILEVWRCARWMLSG